MTVGIFPNKHLIYDHFRCNNKRWGEGKFSVITESNVEPLARNKVDEHRAIRSSQIAKVYHSALTEVLDI